MEKKKDLVTDISLEKMVDLLESKVGNKYDIFRDLLVLSLAVFGAIFGSGAVVFYREIYKSLEGRISEKESQILKNMEKKQTDLRALLSAEISLDLASSYWHEYENLWKEYDFKDLNNETE